MRTLKILTDLKDLLSRVNKLYMTRRTQVKVPCLIYLCEHNLSLLVVGIQFNVKEIQSIHDYKSLKIFLL